MRPDTAERRFDQPWRERLLWTLIVLTVMIVPISVSSVAAPAPDPVMAAPGHP